MLKLKIYPMYQNYFRNVQKMLGNYLIKIISLIKSFKKGSTFQYFSILCILYFTSCLKFCTLKEFPDGYGKTLKHSLFYDDKAFRRGRGGMEVKIRSC